MNKKEIGDIGCNCTIGELAKYGVGIAFPLSDNYRFDLIAIAGERLFKIQVKASSTIFQGAIAFNLTSNNFSKGEIYKYSEAEIDVFALYDLVNNNLYLVSAKEVMEKSSFHIRIIPSKKEGGKYNMAEKYIISKEKIEELFGFERPDFINNFINKEHKRYKNKKHNCVCKVCKNEFLSEQYGTKFCSRECSSINQQKVSRPSKEQLLEDLNNSSMVKVGIKYGVSDNSIRKWAKKHQLNCKKNENDKWIWHDEQVDDLSNYKIND
jgi:hypothetical protein